jgi:hypothetical protein
LSETKGKNHLKSVEKVGGCKAEFSEVLKDYSAVGYNATILERIKFVFNQQNFILAQECSRRLQKGVDLQAAQKVLDQLVKLHVKVKKLFEQMYDLETVRKDEKRLLALIGSISPESLGKLLVAKQKEPTGEDGRGIKEMIIRQMKLIEEFVSRLVEDLGQQEKHEEDGN